MKNAASFSSPFDFRKNEEMSEQSYPPPMLKDVDYNSLEGYVNDLLSIEFKVYEDIYDLLNVLKEIFLEENLVQLPQNLITHIAGYIGLFSTLSLEDIDQLENQMIRMLKEHSRFARKKFDRFLSSGSKKDIVLEQLKEASPGSIIVQTLRLANAMNKLMVELPSSDRGKLFQKKELGYCSPEAFWGNAVIELYEEQMESWEELLGDIPIHYAVNQLVIQLAWLIGYWSYLDGEELEGYTEFATKSLPFFIKRTQEILQKQSGEEELSACERQALVDKVKTLSEQTHRELPPLESQFQKDTFIVQTALNTVIIDLIMEGYEIKVLFTGLYYFWFDLDSSLRGAKYEDIAASDCFSKLGTIIEIIHSTVRELPEPDFSENIQTLNFQMGKLRDLLPKPEKIDEVAQHIVEAQSSKVCNSIADFIRDHMKEGYHPEIIANILLSQWIRFSVFYGISEKEWQKMDYYLKEVSEAIRSYLTECYK